MAQSDAPPDDPRPVSRPDDVGPDDHGPADPDTAEPVDLGVIVAHPIPSGSVGPADFPSAGDFPPDGGLTDHGLADRGPTDHGSTGRNDGPASGSSPVGAVRDGVVEVWTDVRDAHRGPKVNSRPLPRWVRKLAWFLDESIPIGGERRVGVEGVLSFVPGIGDAAGMVASMVVVLAGVGAGVSLPTTALMLANVGIDTLVGAVPFLGAIFDLGYKANTRNMALIEKDLADRAGAKRSALKIFAISALVFVTSWVLFWIAVIASTYLFVRLVQGLF
ncbi:MAG: DUF4112 domain-containing protein [Microthrixaceae bacterium]